MVKPVDTRTPLAGKVALVTGAAGGIGAAGAFALARAGASVALVDRKREALERLRDRLAAEGVAPARLHVAVTDVACAEDVGASFAATTAALGPLDVLFNNAGVEGPLAPIEDCPDERFDEVMRVNVRGAWLNLKHAIIAMRAHGRGGSVVNMCSGAALVGSPGLAAYAASKHAVLGFTRSVALEVAGAGIRVNALCPGPTDTRMMRTLEDELVGNDPAARAALRSSLPMGRYGRPEEIAAALVFLASDASSFVTGAALAVDGGMTAA